MNNEPVAWMHKTATSWVSTFIHPETQPEEWIPLYLHPVKELTDDEIEEFEHLIAKAFDFSTQIKVVGLDRIIRAILKKAQEK
jgi:hypothetical protein